jgi:hypothetical protein
MSFSFTKPGNIAPEDSARIQGGQLQSQLDATPRLVPGTTGVQTKLRKGDTGVSFSASTVTLSQGASKGTAYSVSFPRALAQYVTFQTGSVAPTVDANFPNDGDWGWYRDTVTGYNYFAINQEGTLRYPTITTLPGAITSTQHGDLSGVDTSSARHVFGQITGTISATQHGDLSAAVGTLHGFAQVSGSITAAQHGSQTSGTLHAVASGATAGFMSTTHYTLVNGATASDTASTLALRTASAHLQCARLLCSGNEGDTLRQVVTVRGAAVTKPTGGATIDAEARTAISALIDRLSAAAGGHGLIG